MAALGLLSRAVINCTIKMKRLHFSRAVRSGEYVGWWRKWLLSADGNTSSSEGSQPFARNRMERTEVGATSSLRRPDVE